MPTSVRAARVAIFVMMGLCLLVSVLVGVVVSPRAAGAAFGQNLMGCVLFILAFRYSKATNGVRVTSIVLASVQIVLALGGTARGVQGGIFGLVGAITIVVLLSRRTAGEWFNRPRTPDNGPGHAVK
ncbi:hypothetical protein J7I98_13885 [Streptomyces sp. ISL-98]|uniref:hypothetical protein n=1 Tax=Streptomyces sp. ISL-98 TaxID=2819192 RepID=UPI001BEAB8E4|nr:hypothetical protein [Streptomyces sp. ISL-98]MBT2506961.1 hypothetical protein [Streptomyces sp. ISL-98]